MNNKKRRDDNEVAKSAVFDVFDYFRNLDHNNLAFFLKMHDSMTEDDVLKEVGIDSKDPRWKSKTRKEKSIHLISTFIFYKVKECASF